MPELPELTVYASALADRLAQCQVTRLHASLKGLGLECLHDAELGLIRAVRRVGKQIQFTCDTGDFSVHLMRSGEFWFFDEGPQAYTVGQIDFSNGSSLFVCDRMRQARLYMGPVHLASPDALAITRTEFQDAISSAGSQTIKGFLIDQSRLSGIGNAYADEILWDSRISPKSTCNALPSQVVAVLHASTVAVLTEAIEVTSSHLAYPWRGEYRGLLKVHRKGLERDPCGLPVYTESVAGKTTYYSDVQVLYR